MASSPVLKGVSIDAQAEQGSLPIAAEPTREVALRPTVLDFDAFFAAEYPRLVTLLTAVTGDRTSAEELAQESMLRAHQRWNRVSGYDLPGAWVRRVALNLASNHRARRRTERRLLGQLAQQRSPGPTPVGSAAETAEFWAVVRRLPRRQAAAIALHYLEDRPVTEVATILGCADGTAKAHLHKARANLSTLLTSTEHDHGPR